MSGARFFNPGGLALRPEVWAFALALGIALPGPARACVQGPTRQFLFAGIAGEVPAPLVAIEGVVVEAGEEELTLKLSKAVKGMPAGTEVTIPHIGSHCRNEWGAVEGTVHAIGGFRSFRLPNPVFEAAPLKPQRPTRADWRKYIVDPDYVRKLEGKTAGD